MTCELLNVLSLAGLGPAFQLNYDRAWTMIALLFDLRCCNVHV